MTQMDQFRTYDNSQSIQGDSASPVKSDASATIVNEMPAESGSRRRIKSQASIVSFSSQKIRPPDQEADKFLRRFAVNNEEVSEDNIKYHSLCFGM